MAEGDEKVRDSSTVTEETKAESAQDIESQVQGAMRSRVIHFKEQADSLTFEGVRRLMEKDLGLEAYALDVHKRFVKQCLLECLNGGDEDNAPKSSAETVEETIATAEEVAELPKKQQMKKDVKDSNSENEEKMEDSPVMGLLTGDKKTKTQTKENQSTGNKEVSSENMIKEAIRKRASYLKANSDKITMSGVRQLVEADLELEKNSLFPFKKFIAEKVDEVLSSPKAAQSSVGLEKKISEKISHIKASKMISPEVSSDSSDAESEGVGLKLKRKPAPQRKIQKSEESKKRKRTSKVIKAPRKKQSKQAQASEESSGSDDDVNASEDDQSQSPVGKPSKVRNEVAAPAYGKGVDQLKSIIKSCGMSVPPAVYKRVKQVTENKRETFLIKELEGILAKEGLSADPSEKEIKEVKKRKEREKELEGIDMSNIVSSTRRRSTAGFAPPPKPKLPVESDSDEGEDTDSNDKDGEGDEDDDGDDNDNDEVSNEDEVDDSD